MARWHSNGAPIIKVLAANFNARCMVLEVGECTLEEHINRDSPTWDAAARLQDCIIPLLKGLQRMHVPHDGEILVHGDLKVGRR